MNLIHTLEERFGHLIYPSPSELKKELDSLVLHPENLLPYVPEASTFPYGRRLLLKTDHVEVLAMNWTQGQECAPHDHGNSFGWIRVICGVSTHTLYTLDQHDIPASYLKRLETPQTDFFAPKYQVHSMGNLHASEIMMTLHVYSPPIAAMKVYDIEKCAACVVSETCGAWWPKEQRQILRTIKLTRKILPQSAMRSA